MALCDKNDVLAVLKQKDCIPEEMGDEVALTEIDDVKCKICVYCNIPVNAVGLPIEMLFVWAEIAGARFPKKAAATNVDGIPSDDVGGLCDEEYRAVKSIRQGDTTIEFEQNSAQAVVDATNKFPLLEWAVLLDRFRRIRRVR